MKHHKIKSKKPKTKSKSEKRAYYMYLLRCVVILCFLKIKKKIIYLKTKNSNNRRLICFHKLHFLVKMHPIYKEMPSIIFYGLFRLNILILLY